MKRVHGVYGKNNICSVCKQTPNKRRRGDAGHQYRTDYEFTELGPDWAADLMSM